MEIWIDTADLAIIDKANQMGLIHGVTTNPAILSRSNLPLEELLEEILKRQKGPVVVQVTTEDPLKMIEQGKALNAFSNRIITKVPATASGMKALHALAECNMPTMATAVFDQNQVLLAARAGATYIAPYFSGICEADMNGIESLKAMLRLLHRYNYPAKLIAASLRTAEQLKECAEMGTHAATVNEKVFAELTADHPLTLQSLQRFAKDWKGAKKRKSLPL